MTPQRRRRGHREKGGAMLEGALTLGLLLTILIGTVDVGQVLLQEQALVERARAGARWGAVHGNNATSIRNVVLYQSTPPPVGATAPYDLTASHIAVERRDSGTTADRIQVTISGYQIRFYTPFIAGVRTGRTITAQVPWEGL